MADLAIETHGLVKTFGKNRAVDGVDLAIEPGGVHGFLGPNGAGKTTVIRMLATLLRPDAGTATVLGRDVVRDATEVRRRVSLTGQFASVDEDLTGRENLRLIGRLFGYSGSSARSRADELLEAFSLADAANRQVKKYSGGMRRRLDIAASITVTPELLFLDEPTTGLDPRARNEVWDIIRAMVGGGTTVLLTTQYLEEADQLADRISVIDKGRIVAEGTSPQLKASVGSGSLVVRVMEREERARAREALERALGVELREETVPTGLVGAVGGTESVRLALDALKAADIEVAQLSLGQPTLDEVFLAITGHMAEAEPGGVDDDHADGSSDGAPADAQTHAHENSTDGANR
ncbi:MAG: ATP-binding cassette domain-containing protein [Pseudoclavibacter sp.]